MAKSVQKTKSSLKLRAGSKVGILRLKLGIKSHVLPFEVRLLNSDEYVFVHIPPNAEILKFTADGLKVVTDGAEAEAAAKGFRKSRKRSTSGRTPRSVAMPADVAEALAKIPAGYKLGYDLDGKPKLVKTRKRRKK